MSASGNILREIDLSDPFGITNQTYPHFTDIRGIESDPLSNDIFLTMIGYSNFYFQTMRMNSNGELLDTNFFWYGDDMFYTSEGSLLVGSRTQSPGIFTNEIGFMGSFEGNEQMFVTQIAPVPLPATLWLFCSGLIGIIGFVRKRRT